MDTKSIISYYSVFVLWNDNLFPWKIGLYEYSKTRTMLHPPIKLKPFDELNVILIKNPILQHSTIRFLKYMERTGFALMKNQ